MKLDLEKLDHHVGKIIIDNKELDNAMDVITDKHISLQENIFAMESRLEERQKQANSDKFESFPKKMKDLENNMKKHKCFVNRVDNSSDTENSISPPKENKNTGSLPTDKVTKFEKVTLFMGSNK